MGTLDRKIAEAQQDDPGNLCRAAAHAIAARARLVKRIDNLVAEVTETIAALERDSKPRI